MFAGHILRRFDAIARQALIFAAAYFRQMFSIIFSSLFLSLLFLLRDATTYYAGIATLRYDVAIDAAAAAFLMSCRFR